MDPEPINPILRNELVSQDFTITRESGFAWSRTSAVRGSRGTSSGGNSSNDKPPHSSSSSKCTIVVEDDRATTSVVAVTAGPPRTATERRREWQDHGESQVPPTKKRKLRSSTPTTKTWDDLFDDLVQFRKTYGQPNVTYDRQDLGELSRWVKEQLMQYKKRLSRKESAMTDEQFQKLNSIGFIWNNKCVSWEEKFQQLCDFERQYRHCNVPRRYSPDPKLPTWVKEQRRLYHDQSINPHHKSKLENLGFEWGVHALGRQRFPGEHVNEGYDFDDC